MHIHYARNESMTVCMRTTFERSIEISSSRSAAASTAARASSDSARAEEASARAAV